MSNLNFIIISTVTLLLMLFLLETSSNTCKFETHENKYCARLCDGCNKHSSEPCYNKPGCRLGPTRSIPVVSGLEVNLRGNVNLTMNNKMLAMDNILVDVCCGRICLEYLNIIYQNFVVCIQGAVNICFEDCTVDVLILIGG